MAGIHAHDYHAPLTGSPTVTTPYSLTTLGCRNWPMMAASWRNLTLSISEAIGCRVLTATSVDSTLVVHTPMLTVPNWPEPRCLIILQCVQCTLYISHCLIACAFDCSFQATGGNVTSLWNVQKKRTSKCSALPIMNKRTHCICCLTISLYLRLDSWS